MGRSSSKVYGEFKVDHFRLEYISPNTSNKQLNTTDKGSQVKFIQTTDQLSIRIEDRFNTGNLKAYTLTGKLISSYKLNDQTTYINLVSGAYFLRTDIDGFIKSTVISVR